MSDKAIKLTQAKTLYDNLRSMVAVNFDQATANEAGSYVCYQGAVYLLPDGHTAGTTWANTTKVGPTNIGGEVSTLKRAITQEQIEELLLRDELPGTSKTVTFDSNDNPASITHTANGSTVRTDVFTWGENSVTEVRTASDKRITITTNLTTLAQTISEIEEVA